MQCVMCDNRQQLKSARINHRYKESGLDNVILQGIESHTCPKCGEVYLSYGNALQLHALIAELLLEKKALLHGRELRFLRTYLGYASATFAHLTGYTKESISRMEHGKVKISKPFDRLVRSLVLTRLPDRNYDLHDLWLQEKGKALRQIELRVRRDEWVVEKAA